MGVSLSRQCMRWTPVTKKLRTHDDHQMPFNEKLSLSQCCLRTQYCGIRSWSTLLQIIPVMPGGTKSLPRPILIYCKLTKIIDYRTCLNWSLIHGLSWSFIRLKQSQWYFLHIRSASYKVHAYQYKYIHVWNDKAGLQIFVYHLRGCQIYISCAILKSCPCWIYRQWYHWLKLWYPEPFGNISPVQYMNLIQPCIHVKLWVPKLLYIVGMNNYITWNVLFIHASSSLDCWKLLYVSHKY